MTKRWSKLLTPTETDECRAFIDWTKYVRFMGEPLFERVVKIPNERGKRSVMTAILVAIGLKAGFPDYLICIRTELYGGLLIEAKRIGEIAKPEQLAWRDRLTRWGYRSVVCAGAGEMIAATQEYIRLATPAACAAIDARILG